MNKPKILMVNIRIFIFKRGGKKILFVCNTFSRQLKPGKFTINFIFHSIYISNYTAQVKFGYFKFIFYLTRLILELDIIGTPILITLCSNKSTNTDFND